MAFSLELPSNLKSQRWKVKIRDKERNEPPHVTVIKGCEAWRYGLREGDFLDTRPDPKDVPEGVLEAIRNAHQILVDEWDKMYPENPVDSGE